MAGKKDTSSPFSKFFKEESEEIFKKPDQGGVELTFDKNTSLPKLEKVSSTEESQMREEWKALRKFFISSEGGGLPPGMVPLHFNQELISEGSLLNYPAWISQVTDKSETGSLKQCTPLHQVIAEIILDLYPEPDQGKMIKDLYLKIIKELEEKYQSGGDLDLKEVLKKASGSLRDNLELRGSEKDVFESQMTELQSKISGKGALVPYSASATFMILEAALSNVWEKGSGSLISKINKVLSPLMEILEVETENDPDSANPEHLESAMDFAGTYLDFNKLSSVIPESSSEHISETRYNRIKNVVKTLHKGAKIPENKGTILLQKNLIKSDTVDWKTIFAAFEVIEVQEGKLCSQSSQVYHDRMAQFAVLIKAIRIGELEINNKYVEEIHDDFFEAFDSNFISEEESKTSPPVILIADSSVLADKELKEFSAILHGNTHVNIIALKTLEQSDMDIPVNPASLAVSNRNTYVVQSTNLDPQNLFERFQEGISSYSPSFLNIGIYKSENNKEAFIKTSASVESRDFPGFVYNGKIGTAWGSRFDVKDNPQIEKDWPRYNYSYTNSDNKVSEIELPITYADYKLLTSSETSNFKIVASEFWTEDLIPFSEYLKMTEGDRYRKVPFIWTTKKDNTMVRVAVAWDIVMETGERQDFWNYLQDCGGINSYHAKRALKLQKEQIEKEAEEEITRLKELHAEEIDQTRKLSAEEAMDHLTSALLDLDTESIISEKGKAQVNTSPTADQKEEVAAGEAEVVEEVIEAEEEVVSEEPWIETPLCTNCNECTDINKRMFNYNADKLAFIADPTAGTFAQLVEAAEKCPVKIIHPGKPLNPNEPDLDELIKRAKKFN